MFDSDTPKRFALLSVLVAMLLVACGLTYSASRPKGEPTLYRGRTAAAWEKEVSQWECENRPYFHGPTPWGRAPSTWRVRLNQILGDSLVPVIRQPVPAADLALMEGDDADAMPVLIELMSSPNRKVRGMALKGLENRWEFIRLASDRLLAALDDPDPEVRDNVRLLFFRYDPEAGKAAGLRWEGGRIVRDTIEGAAAINPPE